MSSCPPPLLLLCSLLGLVSGLRLKTSSFSQVPFLSVWNAPTHNCLSKYGVDLNLGTFDIAQNLNQTFMGDNITIFYREKLGLYPWYSGQGKAVNGGVPQNASLDEHLRAASEDIRTYIPDRGFQGLAVVDWESWNPVWERNWDSKLVYQDASIALVRAEHPDWTPAQVKAAARLRFEQAGRAFMEETLKLGQEERPNGLWGYYGFPDCYNYLGNEIIYSGKCPAPQPAKPERRSAPLHAPPHPGGHEGGGSGDPSAPPVYPYTRIVYTYTLDFLSLEHLVYTVGESAALGSAGMVLWGDNNFSKSKATCEAVKFYIDQTLGPYLVNVTAAATLCSQVLCSSQGRCQRRNPASRAYLHLDPAVWKLVSNEGLDGRRQYKVLGRMRADKVTFKTSEFQCSCFPGWGGKSCSKPTRG
ncbi:unnamed protein product [Pleuronectes platessa]|uniref:Hyaluronidase n=1 Tax=Pleuronectes platessa TaxID=8262 RepID=A0A9N7ZEZ5_PLEPL|nr:unnamed protein product [Pleuronectes platessa]